MLLRSSVLVCGLFLFMAGNAMARGGQYVLDGGTPAERQNVHAALDSSAFPWGVVPAVVKIRIGRGYASEATPGTIWLDADLLDAGRFAWGTVQHEYAHQVDYLLLDGGTRGQLAPLVGGLSWWQTGTIAHGELGCERFASTLAWSYWPSRDNTMKPESRWDESAAMKPAAFRALMKRVLGVPDLLAKKPARRKLSAGRRSRP
jgi:hypothetical protein